MSNFSFVGKSISKLENTCWIPLSERLKMIDLTISKINEPDGPTTEYIHHISQC